MVGISAQETLLGTYTNGRTKLVCACKDFTSAGVRLFDFCSIKNSVLDSGSGGTGTELSDVLFTIEQQAFIDPVVVICRFWQMFVVDALLGNFDRHNGNWGFLVNEMTGEAKLAPVFDCASCLLPQADDSIMRLCLSDEREMNARIFSFPTSMLKVDGKKLLLDRIGTLDFAEFIGGIVYLTELQKEFYISYLNARRRHLFGI